MIKKLFKKELCLEKILLLIISAFVFFTMYYYDNQTTFVAILENMHRIVSGQWYYLFNGWSAIPYGLLLQGICGIWALPVFILSEIGLISATSVGARLWYKIFVLIFLLLDTQQLGAIAKKLGTFSEKKILWLKLYFLSSLLVVLPAVHIAQMDAVYLFFIFLGINYYLSDEHWKFLLCFMVAIPGKYFPLFIFIPLILLKEKRYLFIIRDLVVGCALIVFDRGMNSIGYRIENYLGVDKSLEISNNDTMYACLDRILSSEITAFRVPMSLTVVCFGILCIWCFLRDYKEKNNFAVFVSFIGFSILFALGDSTPYWIIVWVPFELLLIFQNSKYYNILFPLEVIFSVAYVYIFIFQTKWILGAENTFSFLLCSLIPNYQNATHGLVADFMTQNDLGGFDSAMSAIAVVCIIGIMMLTSPYQKQNQTNGEEESIYVRGWYWARMGILVSWIILNIWVVMLNHVN